MARKEFVRLLESNILILDKLAGRLHRETHSGINIPRQQLTVLVRLFVGGRARLKDIARREEITTPNLCAVFRKLEGEGLVLRTIDENDRRNTWYSVTERGGAMANQAMEIFRADIAAMFAGLSHEDEAVLISALKQINTIFAKMENKDA
ncbi:MAG: MarR family transcriptional regulator [Muribaculaceae bacterium]|nr:MarR family transcriptional regulator [Muribaculaceae bacterium]